MEAHGHLCRKKMFLYYYRTIQNIPNGLVAEYSKQKPSVGLVRTEVKSNLR